LLICWVRLSLSRPASRWSAIQELDGALALRTVNEGITSTEMVFVLVTPSALVEASSLGR